MNKGEIYSYPLTSLGQKGTQQQRLESAIIITLERERERERDRERQSERDRDRQRQTDRQTNRQTETLYDFRCLSISRWQRTKKKYSPKEDRSRLQEKQHAQTFRQTCVNREWRWVYMYIFTQKKGRKCQTSECAVLLVSFTCLLLVSLFSSPFAIEYIHTKER